MRVAEGAAATREDFAVARKAEAKAAVEETAVADMGEQTAVFWAAETRVGTRADRTADAARAEAGMGEGTGVATEAVETAAVGWAEGREAAGLEEAVRAVAEEVGTAAEGLEAEAMAMERGGAAMEARTAAEGSAVETAVVERAAEARTAVERSAVEKEAVGRAGAVAAVAAKEDRGTCVRAHAGSLHSTARLGCAFETANSRPRDQIEYFSSA